MPESLVEAISHPQHVTFGELSEMRTTIRELADLVEREQPDLVPFFATGSIPYVLPLLHMLYDQKQTELTDGTKFHLFPGLSWGGRIDGLRSVDFFAREFAPLLTGALGVHRPVRVLSIDTTNTGNAVNRIVTAFETLCDHVPDASPESFELSVIGVVNCQRTAGEKGDGSRIEVEAAPQGAPVLTPRGYTPEQRPKNRSPVRFRRDHGPERFGLLISYWVVSNIPSEDEAQLIGARGLHRSLAVDPDDTAGRIIIEFENGLSTASTGLNALGRRFLGLLSARDDSEPWTRLCEANAQPRLTEEDRPAYEEGKFWTQGALRLFELNHTETEQAVRSLLAQNDLESVEIYWLWNQAEVPPEALAKVVESVRRDPVTRGPEALRFFRRARPDLAGAEPDGDDAARLTWWFERLESADGRQEVPSAG